jgi:16S rRNA (adenine1518-N6/adenine1519-N6)-dimethyltransferase
VFWPVPNVDSGLVALSRRPEPGDETLRRAVFGCVDAAFAQRRKTLRAALAGLAGSAAAAEQACRSAGIEPGARGERLGVAEFTALARALGRTGAPETACGGKLGLQE